MKCSVRHWGDKQKQGNNWITVTLQSVNPTHFKIEEHIAVFPVLYDPLREESMRELATKLCAYINDLDTKMNDVKTLMSIAGAKE